MQHLCSSLARQVTSKLEYHFKGTTCRSGIEAKQCMGAILTAAVLLQTTSLVRPCRLFRNYSVSVGYAPTTLIISRDRSPCFISGNIYEQSASSIAEADPTLCIPKHADELTT